MRGGVLGAVGEDDRVEEVGGRGRATAEQSTLDADPRDVQRRRRET